MDFKTLKIILDKFETLQKEQLEVDPHEEVYLSITVRSNTLGEYSYSISSIYRKKYLRLKFEGHPTFLNEKNEVTVETFQDILNAFENSEHVEDINS